jgi:membrane-associated phospholipid phosphatase
MSNLSINLTFPYKPFTWMLWVAALCLAFSYLLVTTGLNTIWMLAIHASPVMPNWFWESVNLGGDGWIVLLLLLVFEGKPGQFTSWILKTWLVGAVLVQGIKHLLPMPRPASVIGVENLSLIGHPPLFSGSMPSGHALAAISFACIACLILRSRGVRSWAFFVISLWACTAAWARVAVGAHWPSDVFAGAGLAILVVTLAHEWERRQSWNSWLSNRNGAIFLMILKLSIAIHLLVPQSQLEFVRFLQFSLIFVALYKVLALYKLNFAKN